jgi:hypothetical protein
MKAPETHVKPAVCKIRNATSAASVLTGNQRPVAYSVLQPRWHICWLNINHWCILNKDIWGIGGVALPFFNSGLNGDEWTASRPCRFTPEEIALVSHWIGGWVGPRFGLDAVEKRKTCLYQESKPGWPARSPLLYRLSYPDSYLRLYNFEW